MVLYLYRSNNLKHPIGNAIMSKSTSKLARDIVTNKDELMALVANPIGAFYSIHGSHLYIPKRQMIRDESILCTWTIDDESKTAFKIQIQVDTSKVIEEDESKHITHCQINRIRGYVCSISLPYPSKTEELVVIDGLCENDLMKILSEHCKNNNKKVITAGKGRKFKRHTLYDLDINQVEQAAKNAA